MSTTIDTDSLENPELPLLLTKLRKPVFKKDAAALQCTQYAVTVNIQPTRLMNKKQWKLYNHDQQRGQLTRLECAMRRENPTIELVEIHFEVCPELGQIHFHALYNIPPNFVTTMVNWWDNKIGTLPNHKTIRDKFTTWRHCDVQQIYSPEGFLKYIRKDMYK